MRIDVAHDMSIDVVDDTRIDLEGSPEPFFSCPK